MKKQILFLLSVFVTQALAVQEVERQEFPEGHYQDSCKVQNYQDDMLTAYCAHKSMRIPSTLDASLCVAKSIENRNGQLICTAKSDKKTIIYGTIHEKEWPDSLPTGYFQTTCNAQGATYKDGVLTAFCDGYSKPTSIYIDGCEPNSAWSSGGVLFCHYNSRMPQGSYQNTYRSPCTIQNYKDGILTALCSFRSSAILSSLDTSLCAANTIRNQNGQLICTANNLRTTTLYGKIQEKEWPSSFPTGLYHTTCLAKGATYQNGVLTALCQKESSYQISSLYIDACEPNSAWSANGRLFCYIKAGFPQGNYQVQGCSIQKYDKNTHVLTAICQDQAGTLYWSILDTTSCVYGGIWNDDGRLVCKSKIKSQRISGTRVSVDNLANGHI